MDLVPGDTIPSSNVTSSPSIVENPLHEVNRSDLVIEKEPFVQGRYSQIYRGIYKGERVVIKRLNGNKEELKDMFLTEVHLLG